MEHVEVLGIKIEAGDRIAIAHVRGCIRVRRQTSARPDADSLSEAAADHEFEFGGELTVLPLVYRWRHGSRGAGSDPSFTAPEEAVHLEGSGKGQGPG